MENKTDIIFPEGMNFYLPHTNAPEYVKGDISIDPKKFVAFLRQNSKYMSPKGYFKINIMVSKRGSWYLKLDTYQPKPDQGWSAKGHEELTSAGTPVPDFSQVPNSEPYGDPWAGMDTVPIT